jgi:hypothetical protein
MDRQLPMDGIYYDAGRGFRWVVARCRVLRMAYDGIPAVHWASWRIPVVLLVVAQEHADPMGDR